MVIDATKDQVIEMGKLAVLASRPVGMGFLQHQANLTKDQIALEPERGGDLYIDYYMGRMVKFSARKVEGGYRFSDTISPDYESWIIDYPDYRALYDAACAVSA